MSNRKLAVLGIVAVLMVVWAVVQSRISKVPGGAPSAGYLIQGLEVAKIAGIVTGTGDDAVRLVRQGRHFVVGNKNNYPAKMNEINDLIRSCLDIRTAELITSNPANHKDLEVAEEKTQSLVKFLSKDGQTITGVFVGKTEPQTGRTYVRQTSSDNVYTATAVPTVPGSPMSYIDSKLIDLERKDIVKVTVTGPEGNYTLRVEDSNDDSIILENIPEGKKLKSGDCGQVFSALEYLSFNDVKKESSEEGKLKFDNMYVCELKDSTVYTFGIARTNDKTFVKCSAEYTGETTILKEKRVESEQELKEKEAKLLARDNADNFVKKHQGWVYEIPEWKAKNLTRKLSELLEEEKEEKTEDTSSTNDSEKPEGEPLK